MSPALYILRIMKVLEIVKRIGFTADREMKEMYKMYKELDMEIDNAYCVKAHTLYKTVGSTYAIMDPLGELGSKTQRTMRTILEGLKLRLKEIEATKYSPSFFNY